MKLQNLAIVAVIALSTPAFAGNPKGENKSEAKNAKTESPAESKTEAGAFTYWVTGTSGSNYLLSTDPDNAQNCTGGQSPCEITSPNALGSTVPKSQVDGQQQGIVIIDRQPQLP